MNKLNARRMVASILGVYGGLVGIEHGYFETLQGNAVPSSIVINAVSPPGLPFPFGNEPAMTIVSCFFVTGVLAIVVATVIILWSAAFIQKKYGGVVLIFLAIILLVVGGGFGPIPVLVVAGATGVTIHSPLLWWRTHLSANLRHLLAKAWPWSLVATLLWVPSAFIVGYVFSASNLSEEALTKLALNVGYSQLGLVLLTPLTAIAYDVERQTTASPQ